MSQTVSCLQFHPSASIVASVVLHRLTADICLLFHILYLQGGGNVLGFEKAGEAVRGNMSPIRPWPTTRVHQALHLGLMNFNAILRRRRVRVASAYPLRLDRLVNLSVAFCRGRSTLSRRRIFCDSGPLAGQRTCPPIFLWLNTCC